MERIETDVCIAGAGYTGLTAALHLTQVGHRVDQGDKLVATDDGTLHRYHGVIPSAGILALASLGLAMEELDSMAKEVPLSDPWEAPHTQEWANQTLGTWRGSRFNVPLDMARQMPAVMDGGGLPSYPSLNTSSAFSRMYLRSTPSRIRVGSRSPSSVPSASTKRRLSGMAEWPGHVKTWPP